MKKLLTAAALIGVMFASASFAECPGKKHKNRENMTTEQKAEFRQKKLERCVERGKSREECQKKMEQKKERMANMTAEERAAKREKRANMTDEERAARKGNRANRTDEERAARREKRGERGEGRAAKKPVEAETPARSWWRFW